jgi:Zn-finger nucleic acid-binding protein
MANCCNCSAPLPANSIVCEYCKTRNDTDLKGIHRYTTVEIESARTCPRCSVSLKTIDLRINDRFLIERCDHCLGLFFDPGELESLLEATVSNVFEINRSKLDDINRSMSPDSETVVYLKCPVCSKLMNRVNFGTKSGVIVDRCRDHGVWLDGGELRRLFEWMKAGGKLLSQERDEQIKKEAARENKRTEENPFSRPVSSEWDGAESSGFDLFGSVLRGSDPDLFVLVKKAARWFTRL